MLKKFFDPIANPDTTSGLDEVVGTFSLNHAQLYVGIIRTEDGTPLKAIRLLSSSYEEGPGIGMYIFSAADANRLAIFLDTALKGDLPVLFKFPRSATRFLPEDGQAEWIISKFIIDWHDGGGYKGTLGGAGGHIITKNSAERLRACLSDFFGVRRKVYR